jgi:hypothetical protein
MEETTFIAITLPGENTPALGTEHITNREDALAWLETHQEYIPNEVGSELEFKSKYIILMSHIPPTV